VWTTLHFMIGGKAAERLNGSRHVTAHPESNRASHRADEPAETGLTLNATPDVASVVQPLLKQFFPGVAPVRFTFWDGSTTGAE
jgi:hypothetical protein